MGVDREAPVAGDDTAEVPPELHGQRPVEPERVPALRDRSARGVRANPVRRRIARDDPGDHEREDDDARHNEQPEGRSASEQPRHGAGFRSYTYTTFG